MVRELQRQAAIIFRTRCKTFTSATEMKHYMESEARVTLSMRTGLVDCTMPPEVQTGKDSRRISKDTCLIIIAFPPPHSSFQRRACRHAVRMAFLHLALIWRRH